MNIERVLITGCGRSRTGYSAKPLSALDIPCGHEEVFSLQACTSGEVDWPESLLAESSWLAAPFLGDLPPRTAILHQVRQSLSVIRSLARIGLFEGPSAYRSFVEEHLGGRARWGWLGALEACLRYWEEWNALVERGAQESGLYYRRIQIQQFDPGFLVSLLGELGFERSEAQVADCNTSGDKTVDENLTWQSLHEGDTKMAVALRAASYGLGLTQ
ncbi:MAG: hypothetical protein ABGY71_11940 [bacterium]|nr:hypothetical protein [Planctomycetota bacterium]HIL51084.1 hypothetical protein [Planctomycetota bacterium]